MAYIRQLFLVGIMAFSTAGFAVDGNHRDFSPKTPEAAAFQQVNDIPVGNYTGTLDLSIPLYTIECGNLRVPISLDYLGSAIRVDQEATWVGLNWILNAGGAITTRISTSYDPSNGVPGAWKGEWRHLFNHLSLRQVYPSGEYNMQVEYKVDGMHPDWRGGYGKEWFAKTTEVVDTANYPNDIPHHLYGTILTRGDGESQSYQATFLGHRISFIWDRLEEEFFITGNAEGFRISGTRLSPIITGVDGVTYQFGCVEQAYPEDQLEDPNLSHFDQTYYLTQITSPTGQIITFSYKNMGVTRPVYKVCETLYDSKYPVEIVTKTASKSYMFSSEGVGQNGSQLLRTVSPRYNFQPMRLTTILVDENGDGNYEQKICFNLSTSVRSDIRGSDRSLDNIEIYRRDASGTDQLLKRFRFQYGYFAKNTTGGNMLKEQLSASVYSSWFDSDDFMYYRLRLDKLWEETVEGSATKKKPAYLFNYSVKDLPCKASAAVDYWGYYNGKENINGTRHILIPKGWSSNTYDDAYMFPDSYLSLHGADRRPDANFTEAGMLKSLTYPTGAKMSFEYEPNTFMNFDYFDALRTSKTVDFKTRTVYASNCEQYSAAGNYIFKEQANFAIPNYPNAEYNIDVSHIKSNQQKKAYWKSFIGSTVLLYRNKGSNQMDLVYSHTLTPADTIADAGIINHRSTIPLSSGNYRLIVNSLNKSTYPSFFYQVNAKISVVQPDFETKGAGLRVKSVKLQNDGVETVTNYVYTKEGETKSSGILMAPAIYARRKLLVYQTGEYQVINKQPVNPPAPKEVNYWMASSDCLTPQAAIGVGYSRVAVSKTSSTDSNGTTVYQYHNKRWGNGPMWDYMRRTEDPKNGLLETQEDYNTNNKLVRRVVNSYTMDCVKSRLRSAVVENIYYGSNEVTSQGTLVSDNAYANVLQGGCMQIYLYPSVQFSLTKQTTTVSDFVAEVPLVTKREATYNQANHLEATVKESTSRTNEYIWTETLYPADYTNGYSNTASLLTNHIVNVPMEVVKSVATQNGQYVTDAERWLYNDKGQPTAQYILKNKNLARSSFTLSSASAAFTNYESISNITYNNACRVRTVTEYGNVPTTYVWGYSNSLPVAVVRGATAFKVQTALNNAGINWDNLEKAAYPTTSISAIHTALSAISGALVTAYEHSPYIGVVKVIAPNGETKSYDYDSFQRLKKVTDHSGIVSSQYEYHYRRE